MPHWLAAFLLGATLATMAGACLVCAAAGWVLGYAHRDFVEWGRRWGRLLAWKRRHRWRPLARVAGAYRELWRDVVHLCGTGELRSGR